MKLDASSITEIGPVRKSNQDSIGLFPELKLFIVADGMGGLSGGELASRLAVESIHSFFEAEETATRERARARGPFSGLLRFRRAAARNHATRESELGM